MKSNRIFRLTFGYFLCCGLLVGCLGSTDEGDSNAGFESKGSRFIHATFPIAPDVDTENPRGFRTVAGSAQRGRFELGASVFNNSEAAFFSFFDGESGKRRLGLSENCTIEKDSLSSHAGLRFRDESLRADGKAEVRLQRMFFADNWRLSVEWKGPKSQEKIGKRFIDSIKLTDRPPNFLIGFLSDPSERKKMFGLALTVWQSEETRRSRKIDMFCTDNAMAQCQFDYLIKEGFEKQWSTGGNKK